MSITQNGIHINTAKSSKVILALGEQQRREREHRLKNEGMRESKMADNKGREVTEEKQERNKRAGDGRGARGSSRGEERVQEER